MPEAHPADDGEASLLPPHVLHSLSPLHSQREMLLERPLEEPLKAKLQTGSVLAAAWD